MSGIVGHMGSFQLWRSLKHWGRMTHRIEFIACNWEKSVHQWHLDPPQVGGVHSTAFAPYMLPIYVRKHLHIRVYHDFPQRRRRPWGEERGPRWSSEGRIHIQVRIMCCTDITGVTRSPTRRRRATKMREMTKKYFIDNVLLVTLLHLKVYHNGFLLLFRTNQRKTFFILLA